MPVLTSSTGSSSSSTSFFSSSTDANPLDGVLALVHLATATPSARLVLCGAILLAAAALWTKRLPRPAAVRPPPSYSEKPPPDDDDDDGGGGGGVGPPGTLEINNLPGPSIGLEEDGVSTTTAAAAPADAPTRRRSYTKVVDGVGVDVQEEIVVAEGWKRHTRVYGGGVCQACLENDRDRGRMM